MCRQNFRVKSSPEEVISADENLLVYSKPIQLYNIFHRRSLCNPLFLSRCLNYKIQAKGERGFTGMVVFNYKDCNNTLQKVEVREYCSCPFCYMRCGSLKGLQLHLNSCHDLFEFEFTLSEEFQTVNVSVKVDAFLDEEDGIEVDKYEPFYFCSKVRKCRKRGARNNARRPTVCFLPIDSPSLASDEESKTAMLTDGNCGLGAKTTELAGINGMSSNTTSAVAHSSLYSDAKAMPTSEAVVPVIKTRKLSVERSEARSHLLLQKRQFYHSHRVQPMSLEQVMSDRDSEDEMDDDVADVEDRQMLDDFEDVNNDEKKFMHLWNSFVRKQRILADGHVPWACEAFSRFHEKELVTNSSLFWCWRLFMIKLWNHGLVDASTINNCNIILENCRNNNNNNNVDHPNDINNNNSVDHLIDINNIGTMDRCNDINNNDNEDMDVENNDNNKRDS